MKLQFKEQDFQIQAVAAVVKCFEGQSIKTQHFTLERSKNIIRKTREIAAGGYQGVAFDNVYFSESIHPVSFQTVQPDQGFFFLAPFHLASIDAA